jgi:hypothetical protein
LRAKSASVRTIRGAARLVVAFDNDSEVSVPIVLIDSFRRRARPRRALKERSEELYVVRVEDGGFTIAWPELDVDFDVVEMLPVYLGFGTTARVAARKAASSTSPAKAAAARANGAKGGRPRKAA